MKGHMVLASLYTKKEVDKEVLNDVYAQVKDLSSNPTPDNRHQLAQLVGYTVNNILAQRLNWLEAIADVRRGSEGEKPEWTLKYSGVVAEIGAKGSTPQISKINQKKIAVPTLQLSVRPKIDHQDLVQRPEMIMDIIEESVLKMENEMVKYIETTIMATYVGLGSPNYATGANVAAATFDAQLTTIQRFGKASILGDIGMVTQLTALTGYNNRVADALMVEANNDRFLGTYKGANVVELTNRYNDESSLADANLLLRRDLLFVVPTGDVALRPIKVFIGGEVRSMDRLNAEDESYEIFMRMDFCAATIGNQKITAVYKDTNK